MNLFKLGTKWGKGKPDFYDLIKNLGIALSHTNDCSPQKGDIILIAKGFTIHALTILEENAHPVTDRPELETHFEPYEIDFDQLTTFARAKWIELTRSRLGLNID